ncbi:MAG: ATP-binding cassette domain-containing protein [Chloroflexota bacterium]|jgi:ABC-2 type transport system ATP-binding protein|nr:ATP-binding cassette domain-containing protein [Chloroflexota bacterium]
MPSPPDPIVSVSSLTRTFQRHRLHRGRFGALRTLTSRQSDTVDAVSDITFDIQPGEMVGYIGQNGAGKSTTIKMLCGILVPTAGSATVLGITPWTQRKQLARRIGVVFGQRTQLWWDLPLRDSLVLLRHMYRVPADRFAENLATAREVLDLDPFLATPVRQLSLGQRMRGDLAAAILHDPDLLILDEPTIGLDLLAKDRIREFLRTLNRTRGTTMLLTTHDLGDIEELCERVMVIDAGRVRFDGDATALQDQFGGAIEVGVDVAHDDEIDLADLPSRVTGEHLTASTWRFRFDRDHWTSGSAVRWLTTIAELRDVSINDGSLEQMIRDLYQSDRRSTRSVN